MSNAYMSSSLSTHFFYSADVLGCFDYPELNALTDAKREVVKFIISAGYVDLQEGSKSREKLESFFPVGTATRTALDALIAIRVQEWTGEQT